LSVALRGGHIVEICDNKRDTQACIGPTDLSYVQAAVLSYCSMNISGPRELAIKISETAKIENSLSCHGVLVAFR